MTRFYIESVRIDDLWGFRSIRLDLDPRINILIGRNGSGKTTVLRLIHSIFSGDFVALGDIDFGHIRIALRGFDSKATRTVNVEATKDGFTCRIGNKKYEVSSQMLSMWSRLGPARWRDYLGHQFNEIGVNLEDARRQLRDLVPYVWLPVSRRLPITEGDYFGRPRRDEETVLDSVDERLRELASDLSRYRLGLDAQLSQRYKEFERRSLQIILYDEEFDRISAPPAESMPTEEDKRILLGAFQEAGLLDTSMRKRIDQHFREAKERLASFLKQMDEGKPINLEDFFIIPLIPRTRAMISAAENLETQREEIFSSLRSYEKLVSRFYENKAVRVRDNGELEIVPDNQELGEARTLPAEHLSSGEKQLFILLTQALLRREEPVVYLADEPELSLHVTWQEQLLSSLMELGGHTQTIVATHSPDIVGPFNDKVIDLTPSKL